MTPLYRMTSAGWQSLHETRWHDVPSWPKLKQDAWVVLDLEEAPSDVWRMEGKPEYAAALIEKRARQEGLVEGASHVVIHRLEKSPAGFQVHFSLFDLELWQQLQAWAAQQRSHCILLAAAAATSVGLTSGRGRVCVSGRQWTLVVQTDSGLHEYSVLAVGAGEDAAVAAAQTLATQAAGLLALGGAVQLEWLNLWWPYSSATLQRSLAVWTQACAIVPTVTPSQTFQGESHSVESVWLLRAPLLARQRTLNPPLDRLSWRAESWLLPVAALTALGGVGLFGLGIWAQQQAHAEQVNARSTHAAVERLQARVTAVNRIEVPEGLLPMAEMAQRIDLGSQADPVELLMLIKRHAHSGLRIQRLRLEPGGNGLIRAFRLEGVAGIGSSGSVLKFVDALQAMGWQVRAVDPADQGEGGFAYEFLPRLAKGATSS